MRSATIQGMLVGEAEDAATDVQAPGALRRRHHEELGRGDDLPAGAVVLADPGLIEVEPIELFEELEVAIERDRRILLEPVEGPEEDAELHAGGPERRHTVSWAQGRPPILREGLTAR